MNKRITRKVNQKMYQGCLNSLLTQGSVKDITERFWLLIRLCKDLHWITRDHYYNGTKMQLFAMSIFSKHTTKRDVYRYVKILKAHSKFRFVVYKPNKPIPKSPHTWTCLSMKNRYIRLGNRWFNQLNFECQFILHWADFFNNITDFKKFINRVKHECKKVQKRSKQ